MAYILNGRTQEYSRFEYYYYYIPVITREIDYHLFWYWIWEYVIFWYQLYDLTLNLINFENIWIAFYSKQLLFQLFRCNQISVSETPFCLIDVKDIPNDRSLANEKINMFCLIATLFCIGLDRGVRLYAREREREREIYSIMLDVIFVPNLVLLDSKTFCFFATIRRSHIKCFCNAVIM